MLLNFDNVRNEKLTAITLQIDQFDARGNPLGVVNVAYDDFEFEKGKFVLRHKIPLHRACMDFYVKIIKAE